MSARVGTIQNKVQQGAAMNLLAASFKQVFQQH